MTDLNSLSQSDFIPDIIRSYGVIPQPILDTNYIFPFSACMKNIFMHDIITACH